jgi:hypothetical protein
VLLAEAVVLLVEAGLLPVEAAVSLVEAAVWAALSDAAGAGAETLLCGWLTGGLVASGALAVASSKAANCEPSESWAGGVGSGRWEEAMAKLARTSDAELGTINPCNRKAATYRLQPAGHRVSQIKPCKFNVLATPSPAMGRQPLRSVGKIYRLARLGPQAPARKGGGRGAAGGRCL